MVAIAIDRYFCICHPFLHAITITRAKIICFFLGMCAACIGIVVALLYGVWQIEDMSEEESTAGYAAVLVESSQQIYSAVTETVNITNKDSYPKFYNTGQCSSNMIYFGETFLWYYQKFYISLY